MTDYQEDSLMDCSGMNCPLPVLKTKKAIDGMNSGEILKMISTDPGSVSYTHLTLPTNRECRSRWSPYH